MVRCRNPWGNESEWKGAFSDEYVKQWLCFSFIIYPLTQNVARGISLPSVLIHCSKILCFWPLEVTGQLKVTKSNSCIDSGYLASYWLILKKKYLFTYFLKENVANLSPNTRRNLWFEKFAHQNSCDSGVHLL